MTIRCLDRFSGRGIRHYRRGRGTLNYRVFGDDHLDIHAMLKMGFFSDFQGVTVVFVVTHAVILAPSNERKSSHKQERKHDDKQTCGEFGSHPLKSVPKSGRLQVRRVRSGWTVANSIAVTAPLPQLDRIGCRHYKTSIVFLVWRVVIQSMRFAALESLCGAKSCDSQAFEQNGGQRRYGPFSY